MRLQKSLLYLTLRLLSLALSARAKSPIPWQRQYKINPAQKAKFTSADVVGPYVQNTSPIQRCGVESLYIEQTENLWISTAVYDWRKKNGFDRLPELLEEEKHAKHK